MTVYHIILYYYTVLYTLVILPHILLYRIIHRSYTILCYTVLYPLYYTAALALGREDLYCRRMPTALDGGPACRRPQDGPPGLNQAALRRAGPAQ
jgi:hypothetical protein